MTSKADTNETGDEVEPGNAVLRARVAQLEQQIVGWIEKPVQFEFDASGTHLFSILEQMYSYPKRFMDLSAAIHSLLEARQIVPAAIVARSLLETIGMGCLYLKDMEDLIRAGDSIRLEEKLKRYYAGGSGSETRPVHVMDAVRYLKKLDEDYVSYLETKWGMFSKVQKHITNEDKFDEVEFYKLISVSSAYDSLSDVSHPNGLGTNFIYPHSDNMNDDVKKILSRFEFWSLTAIWYGRYLGTAMENAAVFPELFRAIYLPADNA